MDKYVILINKKILYLPIKSDHSELIKEKVGIRFDFFSTTPWCFFFSFEKPRITIKTTFTGVYDVLMYYY